MNRILSLQRMRIANNGPSPLVRSKDSCKAFTCSYMCNK